MPFWPFTRANTQQAIVPAASPSVAELDLKSEVSQWSRLDGILQGSITTVDNVKRMQAAASTQLDAAGYALNIVLAELATVMTLPAPAHTADILKLEIPPRATKMSQDKETFAA